MCSVCARRGESGPGCAGAAGSFASAALEERDRTHGATRPLSSPHLFLLLSSSRAAQAAEKGGDEKESVKAYFNEVGFERWSRIYSDTDDVNKVQLDIRTGHAQTVDKVLGWIGDSVKGVTVCDAGCGTGSLSIPLALRVSEKRDRCFFRVLFRR